jgi:endonuclease YncB( thermonuclease family)
VHRLHSPIVGHAVKTEVALVTFTPTPSAAAKSWQAVVTSVHDGDTFDATVILGAAPAGQDTDYGFHIYKEHPLPDGKARFVLHTPIRLLGCNARELADPGGPEARAAVLALLPIGSVLNLTTASPDKYGGRYDAGVRLLDGTDVILLLEVEQWVAAWTGSGPRPVPPWPRTVSG